jgi:DNA-binding NarL/FixJ family response regulator
MIVDDHPVTRDGLRSALSAATEIEIVGEAGSGDEAVTLAKEVEPDLLFMDVQMPGMDGLEAAKQIRADRPDTKVILFTVEESTAAVAEAMQAGMSGYLLKDVTPDELIRAAHQAMEGKAVIPRSRAPSSRSPGCDPPVPRPRCRHASPRSSSTSRTATPRRRSRASSGSRRTR